MIEDIQIGITRRLGDQGLKPDALAITIHEDLYREFITDIQIERSRKILIRVGSFGFLYSLIRQVYLLESCPSVQIEIGEGGWLVGKKLDCNGIELDLLYDNTLISQHNMTIAQFLVQLSVLISKLVESIRAIDIDVDSFIRKFSPPLF